MFKEDYDFKFEELEKNITIQIRKRKSVSIDECARLCMLELSFKCESASYESVLRECKWSSLSSEHFLDLENNSYIQKQEGYALYLSKIFEIEI